MNQSLFNWINQFADQTPFLDWFMITSSEYAVWVMIALLVIVWFLGDPSKQRIVFYACVASIVALVLTKWGISPAVGHPRPFVEGPVHQLVAHVPDPSFPSKHASFVFALAAASFFIGRRFGLWMLLLAVLTGVSRVYVGVHYPGDILGGFILGSLLSVVLIITRNYTKSIPDFFINIHRRVFR
ncbi:Undecaprenyl-diphosphatase [Paenibacillus sp. CF095]|uniref:undecaprenyl-diphosphatase n=1 Tax=Paenibacillus sp. CF095 TaxID=1881033 RepID=UPI00088D481C|nr:undecaprenyl-diphosphatase [Paenibacillus sp. CF095]SDD04300.1 Undecaprenyl-diphosphatase [Paenibacillus sp. CF095]